MTIKTQWMLGLLAALVAISAPAARSQALINQAAVTAAGGFPYMISQPGSYKLSGNLTNTTTSSAILIESNNVTLDLNGYTILGPGSKDVAYPGTYAVPFLGTDISALKPTVGIGVLTWDVENPDAGLANITVKNGTIRGFNIGAYLLGSGLVSDLRLVGNQSDGLDVDGFVVVRCGANSNVDSGIAAADSSVSESVANANGTSSWISYGLSVYTSVVSNSTSNGNLGSLKFPVNPSIGLLVSSSSAIQNTVNSNLYDFGLILQNSSVGGSNTMISNFSDLQANPLKNYDLNNNRCSTNGC